MSHLLPLNKKEFYIELHESRYYFPGDVIKGTVVLNLAKPTKTNHIRITLTGTVQSDKTATQVIYTTSFCLATSPLNDGKPHLLPAKTHRLPFEFELPNDDDTKLPSSLKLSKSMWVKYVITAIHDRPLLPERFSGVIKKEIRVLERIDITEPKYGARGRVTKDVCVSSGLPTCSDGDKVHLSLTLPQYAVVRGDVFPMEIHIKHFRKLTRADGIKVHLIRRVYTGEERKKAQSKSINSNVLGIDITPTGEFEQKISTKLFVPTHTPPTLSQIGRILAVEYKARVIININDPYSIYRKNHVKLESHVVIGTYPKPNLSIDEDDDDDDDDDGDDDDNNETDIVEGLEEISISDDDDDDEEPVDGDTKPATWTDQSSSAHIVEPPSMRQQSSTTPTHHYQQHQQQHSPIARQQQRDPRHSLPLQQRQPSSSSSLTVVDPTVVPKQQHASTSSSPSLSSVAPATPPKQQHALPSSSPSLSAKGPATPPKQLYASAFSSSTTSFVVDPTVPTKQHHRPVVHQRQQSSSSSITVVDPTVPTASIHTGRRQSYLPQQSSSSAMVIDPTTITNTPTPILSHDPRRHAQYPPSNLHRHSLQQGTASIIDPTAKLYRNESTLSSLSSTSSQSSSSGGSSSSATLVEPPSMMMMKPDRNNHSSPSLFTPTSPTFHPIAMASMPDITAYIPSKSSGLQQKKRPPLHLNPIATSSPHQQQQQPSSPAATVASPGGFVVPVPTQNTQRIYPPPLPPRRPSSQQQQQPPTYYYQHPSNPSYPWS